MGIAVLGPLDIDGSRTALGARDLSLDPGKSERIAQILQEPIWLHPRCIKIEHRKFA